MSAGSFHLPFLRRLHCPVMPGLHPDYEFVARDTIDWADGLGLLATPGARQRLVDTDCARLGAAVYHDGYAREAVQLATDFMTWLYLHDDLWVDGAQRDPSALESDHARLLAVLCGAPASRADHELCHALLDLRRRLGEYGADLSPFVDSVEQYLTAKFWESTNHRHGITPDVRLYIHLRGCGGGVPACFEVGALVRPIHLTRHLRNHAYVQTLAHLANQLVCWANDMASLKKELAEGITTNLVMAIRHEHSLGWSDAMVRATVMWNDAMSAFVRLAGQLGDIPLSDFERAQLEKYLVLLASWVRGNLDYDRVVRRFDALAPDGDQHVTH